MSTLKVSTLQNLSGTEVYTCKAWVNFNGTGTVAIRASGNVSSITDNGTGDYTVNFTNAMPDANYSTSFSSERAGGRVPLLQTSTYSTTAVRLNIVDVVNNALNGDSSICCVAIFR
jgi:hypothetical protein